MNNCQNDPVLKTLKKMFKGYIQFSVQTPKGPTWRAKTQTITVAPRKSKQNFRIILCHEVAHYLVALPQEREWDEFGLGTDTDNPKSKRLKGEELDIRTSDAREEATELFQNFLVWMIVRKLKTETGQKHDSLFDREHRGNELYAETVMLDEFQPIVDSWGWNEEYRTYRAECVRHELDTNIAAYRYELSEVDRKLAHYKQKGEDLQELLTRTLKEREALS